MNDMIEMIDLNIRLKYLFLFSIKIYILLN